VAVGVTNSGWRQVALAGRETLQAFGYKIKRIIDVISE